MDKFDALKFKSVFEPAEIAKLYENQNEFSKTKSIPPNFKYQILKYGTALQVSTLANSLPNFKFQNSAIQKSFEEFVLKFNLLEKIQELEAKLYSNGKFAFGFLEGFPIIAEILEYSQNFKNELTSLVLRLNSEKKGETQNDLIFVFEKNNPVVKQFKKITTISKTEIIDLSAEKNYSQILISDFIPFVIFKNKFDGKSDLELVNEEFFKAIDTKITQLQLDAYYSTPLPILYASPTSSLPQQMLTALFSLESGRVYTHKTANDLIPNPLNFLATTTQTPQILDSIKQLIALIKRFLFLKQDTQDSGTHNLHNAEVQQINSDFDDWVESKANLREIYYSNFLNLWLKINNLIDEVEVVVVGSTKWLQQEAEKLKKSKCE